MNVSELRSRLHELNIEVVAAGNRLRFRPAERVNDQLRAELKAHKTEFLGLLRVQSLGESLPGSAVPAQRSVWPEECLEAVDRFRQPHARLFPLLGRSVLTPMGRGQLVQVLAPNAAVVLDGQPRRVTFFHWEEIGP